MNPKTKIRALDALIKSKGWQVVAEVMAEEQVAAAMAIADNPQMTLDEINFRRGAIWAATQLQDLPSRLIQRLQADVALSKDDSLTSSINNLSHPAKAGQGDKT